MCIRITSPAVCRRETMAETSSFQHANLFNNAVTHLKFQRFPAACKDLFFNKIVAPFLSLWVERVNDIFPVLSDKTYTKTLITVTHAKTHKLSVANLQKSCDKFVHT